MPKIIPPDSEEHWHELRAQDITSTESAALLGMSPYHTAYELWHRKTGQLAIEIAETARMKWGKRLEPVIAAGVAADHGVTVEHLTAYARHDTVPRMGASFDYLVTGIDEEWTGGETPLRRQFQQFGPGLLEIKNVDWLIFRDQWAREEDGIEAPVHIELQLQHQLEVLGKHWGAVVVLVGGNNPEVLIRQRDEEVGLTLARKIGEFWETVDANIPPPPDYERDGKTLAELHRDAMPGKEVDLRHSNRLAELCAEYKWAADDEKAAKGRKDAAKAEIIDLIGDAERALANGFTISAKTTAETEVPAFTRKAFRNIRITQKKGAA